MILATPPPPSHPLPQRPGSRSDPRIHPHDSAKTLFSIAADGGRPPSLEELERAYVARVLDHFEGHRTTAAQALGVSYPTFLKRLRDFDLDR